MKGHHLGQCLPSQPCCCSKCLSTLSQGSLTEIWFCNGNGGPLQPQQGIHLSIETSCDTTESSQTSLNHVHGGTFPPRVPRSDISLNYCNMAQGLCKPSLWSGKWRQYVFQNTVCPCTSLIRWPRIDFVTRSRISPVKAGRISLTLRQAEAG